MGSMAVTYPTLIQPYYQTSYIRKKAVMLSQPLSRTLYRHGLHRHRAMRFLRWPGHRGYEHSPLVETTKMG